MKRLYQDHPASGTFYHLSGPAEFIGRSEGSFKLVRVGAHVARWSGSFLPQVGDRVLCSMNGFGPAVVVAYFVEGGDKEGKTRYLGVEIICDERPDWHIRQNGSGHPHPLVFGTEIKEIE